MKLSTMMMAALPLTVVAQDPAQGWLGYATGVNPAGGDTPITFMEAYWKNCEDPTEGGAFFSPWFGIETSDNLNLLQPVNPWTGDGWQIYNEYFQWRPTHNQNSNSHSSSAGDVLYGSVTLNAEDHSYTLVHKDITNGAEVSMTIPIQKKMGSDEYKAYTIAYIVFEKEARCSQYPPDGEVTFYNITVEYGGEKVSPTWTTGVVDDVCNNRAHIVDESTVKITWDTSMDNGRPQKQQLKGLHPVAPQLAADNATATVTDLGNCKKDSYAFCCEVGTPCDCTKGVISPGQCKKDSYAFCCSIGTPCDCTQPPL